MSTEQPSVYVAMAADILHHGHINIIAEAAKLGKVTVGVLTDEAVSSYKRVPYLPFDQRKLIVENLKGVEQIVAQTTLDYEENLRKIKPQYVVHGSDWKTGVQKPVRDKVIQTLAEWGGQLIEPDYTGGISSTQLQEQIKASGITPDVRRSRLRRLIQYKPIVRIMEAHNGLTGRIVEETYITNENGFKEEFDGMWESSLTDSTSKGKPDTGAVDNTSRTQTIDQILEVTTKPMIVDADNGGQPEHFTHLVRNLERKGVSAVIIEDKVGLKKNSLFGTDVDQTQDDPEAFAYKIHEGKQAQVTTDFMIIARTESLILKKGLDDALMRAKTYINAGVDGIMIHSKEKSPQEVLDFCREYNKFENRVPLVAVPSSYSSITEQELINAGVNIVIYANHLLRSAYPAMVRTAETILHDKSCDRVSKDYCMPIKEILTLIPEK